MEPQQRKKVRGNRGCLIAALIVLGVFGLIVVAIAVTVYRASQDPEVQRALVVARKSMSISASGASAPGTKALSELGCRRPMVVDTQRLVELAETIRPPDAGSPPAPRDLPPLMVMCQVPRSSTLTCEQVVRTYVDAVEAAPPVVVAQVFIERIRGSEIRCGGTFDQSGKLLKPMEEVPLPEFNAPFETFDDDALGDEDPAGAEEAPPE